MAIIFKMMSGIGQAAVAPGPALARTAPVVSRRNEPPDYDKLLFRAAKDELFNIGILTAATCSAVNYYDQFEGWHADPAVFCFVPPDPVTLPVAARVLADRTDGLEAAALVERFSGILDEGKRKLKALTSAPDYFATIADRETLTSLWSAAVGALLVCIYEFERHGEFPVSPADQSMRRLCEVLIGSRDGGSPCCLNGQPSLPDWATKRRFRRIFVNMDARLRVRGAIQNVRVIDVSRGGAGLDFSNNLRVDDIVGLEFAGGRRFSGIVAWVSGARAGVTFATELAANDPLISSG